MFVNDEVGEWKGGGWKGHNVGGGELHATHVSRPICSTEGALCVLALIVKDGFFV